jgi:hypothetical protein
MLSIHAPENSGNVIKLAHLYFRKYRKRKFYDWATKIALNGFKKEEQNASLWIEKLEFIYSSKSNSLNFLIL